VFDLRARPLDDLRADVRALAVTKAAPAPAPGAKPVTPNGRTR